MAKPNKNINNNQFPPQPITRHPHHDPQHHHQQQQQQHPTSSLLSYGVMQSSSSATAAAASFINMDRISKDDDEQGINIIRYDEGSAAAAAADQIQMQMQVQDDDLDHDHPSSLFLNYLTINDHHHHHHHQQHAHDEPMLRPPPTLNIFPSEPMHVDPSPIKANDGLVSPAATTITTTTALESKTDSSGEQRLPKQRVAGNHKGPIRRSEKEILEPKVLRRLAQNREAARKSRLRKKAYVHQLESSRIRLHQIEQELQRARNQGSFGGDQQGIPIINNISQDAAVFDMEHGRWMEEHHRMASQVRAALQENVPENELRHMLENCLARFEELLELKAVVIKSDVFHIFSGMWKPPAERCFMWIGGFRPSDLIKVILNNVEPLSEQQILAICELQQSTQHAEGSLSHGLDLLNRSLSDAIGFDHPQNMALAVNKLSSLEGFIKQAENLRHETVHRVYQYLTTQQAARYVVAITEYFHRLRALGSLWMGRPRLQQPD